MRVFQSKIRQTKAKGQGGTEYTLLFLLFSVISAALVFNADWVSQQVGDSLETGTRPVREAAGVSPSGGSGITPSVSPPPVVEEESPSSPPPAEPPSTPTTPPPSGVTPGPSPVEAPPSTPESPGPSPVSPAPSESESPAPSEAPSATPSESPAPAPSGGGGLPSATPSESPAPAPSESPSSTPSESPAPAPSESPSSTPSESPAPAPTPSSSPSPSPTPSAYEDLDENINKPSNNGGFGGLKNNSNAYSLPDGTSGSLKNKKVADYLWELCNDLAEEANDDEDTDAANDITSARDAMTDATVSGLTGAQVYSLLNSAISFVNAAMSHLGLDSGDIEDFS
jgi:hypothetical protein